MAFLRIRSLILKWFPITRTELHSFKSNMRNCWLLYIGKWSSSNGKTKVRSDNLASKRKKEKKIFFWQKLHWQQSTGIIAQWAKNILFMSFVLLFRISIFMLILTLDSKCFEQLDVLSFCKKTVEIRVETKLVMISNMGFLPTVHSQNASTYILPFHIIW